MCWNKESSLTGFILNILLVYFHLNSRSKKFIPIFITIALTQLCDFLIYMEFNKFIIGKFLGIIISLQIFFIYKIFNLPKILFIIPIILFLIYIFTWDPYTNYKNNKPINWNEIYYNQLILIILWLIIPLYFLLKDNNIKDINFILISLILLIFSNKINFGSIGKNWCMLGLILNLLTLFIYN